MPQRLLPSRLTPFLMMSLALFVLMMQGCGGGGGNKNETSNADPTGYYINTGFVEVKESDNMTQRRVTGIQGMVHGGQLMMLSDTENLTYVGIFTVSGNDLSGSVTLYEDGVVTQEDIPLSGLITATSKITGELGGTGAANGTFQLDYAPLADNGPVDMAMVIHNLDWEAVSNSDSFTISIGSDAAPIPNFSGGSGLGAFDNCGFLGRLEPIPEAHLYTVSGTMRDCVNNNILMPDAYSGLISVRGIASNNRLIMVLSNGVYVIGGEYFRQ